MAWTTPVIGRVGVLTDAPWMDTYVKANLDFLHGAPACLFTRTAAGQTFAHSSDANLVFPDAIIDTDGMLDDSTHMGFTTAGVYMVGFSFIAFAANAVGSRQAKFYAPDVTESVLQALANTGSASDPCTLSACGIIHATAGQQATVAVAQRSGGNLDIAPGHITFAHWIGGPL